MYVVIQDVPVVRAVPCCPFSSFDVAFVVAFFACRNARMIAYTNALLMGVACLLHTCRWYTNSR